MASMARVVVGLVPMDLGEKMERQVGQAPMVRGELIARMPVISLCRLKVTQMVCKLQGQPHLLLIWVECRLRRSCLSAAEGVTGDVGGGGEGGDPVAPEETEEVGGVVTMVAARVLGGVEMGGRVEMGEMEETVQMVDLVEVVGMGDEPEKVANASSNRATRDCWFWWRLIAPLEIMGMVVEVAVVGVGAPVAPGAQGDLVGLAGVGGPIKTATGPNGTTPMVAVAGRATADGGATLGHGVPMARVVGMETQPQMGAFSGLSALWMVA